MRGEEPPRHFYDKPDLDEVTGFYLTAWMDLSTERPIGFGIGQIPRSKIKEYGAEDLQLFGDELAFFISVIRQADQSYLDQQAAAADKEAANKEQAEAVKNTVKGLAANGERQRFRKPRPVR